MNLSDEDILVLAGEYVLGLHDGTGVKDDPRFAAAVQGWSARLMPLAEEVQPVTPPARLWAAIEAAIAPRPRLRDSVKFWRGLAFGGAAFGAAGLALALALLLRPPAPVALAALTTASEGSFIATAQGGTLTISPQQASVPAGKSAELWLLPPGGAPLPLGLLAAAHPVTLRLPASLAGAKLAISLEPPGGSPTGLPTGPVIATANFLSL